MVFEAGTHPVASEVHLLGDMNGRSSVFQSDDAGIAEAIIASTSEALRRLPGGGVWPRAFREDSGGVSPS